MENLLICSKCFYKAMESQFYKSKGYCPKGKYDQDGKYDDSVKGCGTLVSSKINGETSTA